MKNDRNRIKISGLWRYDVLNSKTLFDFVSFLNFFTVHQSAFSGNTHFFFKYLKSVLESPYHDNSLRIHLHV